MKIRHLYISPDHNYFGHHGKPSGDNPTIEVEQVECVANKGIKGDRFFEFKADYKGQITFFSHEVYEALCNELNVTEKGPDVFRRNAVVEGVDLNELIGKEFELQGIKFLAVQECSPCYWMDQAFGPGAEEFLKGKGGLRCRILSDGVLKVDT